MLRLEGVSARTGAFRLGPLDLSIRPETRHALLGPSGAGKSTLLELIIGFRTPTSGRILMKGRDLTPIPVEKRGIGYLPQRLALFPHLSVRENILYGIASRRKPSPSDLMLIDSLGRALGIHDLMTRKPESLSGGERQRVALARAVAPAPELLLLDEPFSSLNETLRRELWVLLKALQMQHRFTLIMITHDLEEAFFMGEHIAIVIDGALHQSDTRKEVFHHPATVQAAQFLGIRNLFPAQVIGREGVFLSLDCERLATRLLAGDGRKGDSGPRPGDRVTVGIRSELVALRHNGQEGLPGEVRLDGKVVDITETGRGVTLGFRPKGSDTLLEVTAGPREAALFDMHDIQAGIPAAGLFCIPEGGHPVGHSEDSRAWGRSPLP